jgi:hypothetical protein
MKKVSLFLRESLAKLIIRHAYKSGVHPSVAMRRVKKFNLLSYSENTKLIIKIYQIK